MLKVKYVFQDTPAEVPKHAVEQLDINGKERVIGILSPEPRRRMLAPLATLIGVRDVEVCRRWVLAEAGLPI